MDRADESGEFKLREEYTELTGAPFVYRRSRRPDVSLITEAVLTFAKTIERRHALLARLLKFFDAHILMTTKERGQKIGLIFVDHRATKSHEERRKTPKITTHPKYRGTDLLVRDSIKCDDLHGHPRHRRHSVHGGTKVVPGDRREEAENDGNDGHDEVRHQQRTGLSER